jgi:hypothetical protein
MRGVAIVGRDIPRIGEVCILDTEEVQDDGL